MARPSRNETMLAVASVFAHRSTCPRAQVGVVIVRDGHVLAHGYNGAPPGMPHCTEHGCDVHGSLGCLRATHAELNAIAYAARVGVSCEQATMYSTHQPCLGCARTIIAAGIKAVWYLEPYRNDAGTELLKAAGIPTYWASYNGGHEETIRE